MPNPFFFAGKITNPEYFVGREKETNRILGYLDVNHTGQIQHASIVGERRIGKSSLLYHLYQVYEKQLKNSQKYRFLYIDLDDPHCHTQNGLLRKILQSLELPAPKEPTLERFYELIEQQHSRNGWWPVFLLDEFEHLPKRAKEFPDEFFETLRSLGNNNIVGLVTASQHPLSELAAQGRLTSPFFNIFHQMELKEFGQVEVDSLLNRGRVSDMAFTNDDCGQIQKIAGNHPARVQVVASLAYEARSRDGKVDWKAVKEEALKEHLFRNRENTKNNWLLKPLIWLFWLAPQYIGHAIMVLIGRGEHTNDTTDRIIGYAAILIVLGVVIGVIPWSLVTKYTRRFSELFIR
jgi:hypothetical protein